MNATKRWSLNCRLFRSTSLVLLLCGYLMGCTTIGPGGIPTSKERTVWKVREQFVSIVPQERGTDPAIPANNQPVEIPSEDLYRLFASVQVVPQGEAAPVPLFTETELLILKDAASTGLLQAGPTEDVVFAVFGYYQALMGLAKVQKVTTGRLFYQDGQLNLILGIVHRDVMDWEDRRLNPFVPGSRLKVAQLGARVVPAGNAAGFSLKRADWLTFNVDRDKGAPAPVAPVVAPPAPPEIKQPTQVAPPPQPTASPAKKSTKGIEERLMQLNDLKSKKLITDEEYRAKRQEILNEL